MRAPSEIERTKYERIWALPEYSQRSPGESAAEWLLAEWPLPWANDLTDRWVVDVGCGNGCAGKVFADKGCHVSYVDHVKGPQFVGDELSFVNACIWHDWVRKVALAAKSLRVQADLAFCVDVLEHVPVEFTMLAARQLLDVADYAFVQVAHFDDRTHGDLIRDNLHLTLQPFEWWRDRLSDLGAELIEARDCIDRSSFLLRSK